MTIVWAKNWPNNVIEGLLELDIQVADAGVSKVLDNQWQVGEQEQGESFVMLNDGDTFAPEEDLFDKTTLGGDITNQVEVSDDGTVTVPETLFNKPLEYELIIQTTAAQEDYVITDTPGDYLTIPAGEASIEVIEWDDEGLNRSVVSNSTVSVEAGNTFSTTLDLKANTEIRIRYNAQLDIDQKAQLEAALQAKYDSATNGNGFSLTITNNVIDNIGHRDGANRNITNASTIGLTGFSKTTRQTNDVLTQLNEDGTPTESLVFDYVITADLTQGGINQNVIVRDELPEQGTFLTDPEKLYLTQEGSETPIALTQINAGDDPQQAIQDAAQYSYVIYTEEDSSQDGSSGEGNQVLLVNLGTDEVAYKLYASASVNTTVGLPTEESETGSYLLFTNHVEWYVGDTRVSSFNRENHIWEGDDSDTIQNEDAFVKEGPDEEIRVTSGEWVAVPFTFRLGSNIGNISEAVITDLVDHEVFDVTSDNLDSIAATVTGRIANRHNFIASDFALTLNAENNLEIRLSDAGKQKLLEYDLPENQGYSVTIQLPTVPVGNKHTLDIENESTYKIDGYDTVFSSSSEARVSSYGDELEVAKAIYSATAGEFNTEVEAPLLDDKGNLVNKEFVYRVRLLPHGSFNNMTKEVVDNLPENVEFIGFVNSATDTEVVSEEQYTVPGSAITAKYVNDANTIRIAPGQLTESQPTDVLFRVRVTKANANEVIRNQVTDTAYADIIPVAKYAVGDVVWVDANGNGVQDDGELPLPGVRVELLDADGGWVSTRTTNAAGKYLFDTLIAGVYSVRFTLSDDQAELYEFTSKDSSDDESVDSDASVSDADPRVGVTKTFTLDESRSDLLSSDEYTDQVFTASAGIDPTWDAGVIKKPADQVPSPTVSATPTPSETSSLSPNPGPSVSTPRPSVSSSPLPSSSSPSVSPVPSVSNTPSVSPSRTSESPVPTVSSSASVSATTESAIPSESADVNDQPSSGLAHTGASDSLGIFTCVLFLLVLRYQRN